MERQVEVIAGECQVRVGRLRLLRRDESERLPKGLSDWEIRRRQAQFGKVSTQRDRGRVTGYRRVGTRLEYGNLLTERIAEPDLVENLLPGLAAGQMDAGGSEGGDGASDPRSYESQDGRYANALMQPYEQAPVGEHTIGMGEGVGGRRLAESKALVELDGAAHLGNRDTELVEGPRERQRGVRHHAGAPCAVPGRCERSPCVQLWQRCATRSARQ